MAKVQSQENASIQFPTNMSNFFFFLCVSSWPGTVPRIPTSNVVWNRMENLSATVKEFTTAKKSTLNNAYKPSTYQSGELFPKTETTRKIKQNNIGKFM